VEERDTVQDTKSGGLQTTEPKKKQRTQGMTNSIKKKEVKAATKKGGNWQLK